MLKKGFKNYNSEDDGESQDLNENGKRLSTVANKDGKKRFKTKSLYRQPTVKELNRLQETENLFNSNLFRLQVEEILQEVKITEKTEKKFQQWFIEFKNHLQSIPEDDTEYDLTEHTLFKKLKIKSSVNKELKKTKCVFKFHKFQDIEIVGSYALGCSINSKLRIDIQIIVPSETYTKNDSINYRYHKKRAAYLAYIASHLKKLETIEELTYSWLNGCETNPVIDLKPTKYANHFTVRIYLACAEEAYKFHRFTPIRNNLRSSWLFEDGSTENSDVSPPTPYYNSSILADLRASSNHVVLKETLLNSENLKQAVVLLKIWLRQRKLEVSGHVVALFVAYMVQIKRINNIMSSYQIVRNVWIALKAAEWDTQGISLHKGQESPPMEEFLRYHPVVFLDKTGYYNICWQMSKGTYYALKRESALAIDMLDDGRINSFIPLFMTPVQSFLQFDHILRLKNLPKLKDTVKTKASKEDRLHYGLDDLALVTDKLSSLLARGLGNRVDLILPIIDADFSWPVTKNPEKVKKNGYEEKLSFGLILNPENALNIVEKGPSANLPEAEEFRSFWGDKSELRRFQDGSITEACVWEGDSIADRRGITKQIVDYLMKLKFDISPSDLFHVCDQLDSLTVCKQYAAQCEESSLEALRVFDELRRDMRSLTELPLDVSAVYGKQLFHVCDQLDSLTVCKQYAAQCEESSLEALRVFDELRRDMRSLTELPLDVSAVYGKQLFHVCDQLDSLTVCKQYAAQCEESSLEALRVFDELRRDMRSLTELPLDVSAGYGKQLFHVCDQLDRLTVCKQYAAQCEESSLEALRVFDELRRDMRSLTELPLDVSAVYGKQLFHVCDQLDSLTVCKQYAAQCEESSLEVLRVFDELRRDMRSLTELPLDVSAVYGKQQFHVCDQLDSLTVCKQYAAQCEESSLEALRVFDELRRDMRSLTELPLDVSAGYGKQLFHVCDQLDSLTVCKQYAAQCEESSLEALRVFDELRRDMRSLTELPLDVSAGYGKQLFHVCDQLDSLTVCKQYAAQCEESSLEALRVFDELRRDMRSLTELPLDVSAVYGVSPVFSYCDPMPPLPHGAVRKPWQRGLACLVKQTTKDGNLCVPEYTPVCRAVVELGHSGKWPGDIEAFRCLKAAFHLQIAERLHKQFSLPTQAYPTHVDVLKSGLVFRLEISHPKEITLLRREMDNGVVKYRESEESVNLQCDSILMPRLRGALHGLHQKHPAFGPTACLLKRWLSAHLLSPPHFPAPVAELLAAAAFLRPAPLAPPAHPTLGLLRALALLAHTDWTTEMIVLDFNEDMTREEITEVERKFRARAPCTPPHMYMVTAYDGELSSVWSARAPGERVVRRARALAAGALRYFQRALMEDTRDNVLGAFVPSLAGYDVLIQLHPSLVPYASERVNQSPGLRPLPDILAEDVIPVVEFDPVRRYLEELRSAYSDFALFFHDSYGGDVIAVLWKPDIAHYREFQLSNANALMPVEEDGEVKYRANTAAIVEDFRTLGQGLVKNINICSEAVEM